MLKKNTGKITGWISYALSWSYRKFPEINNGKKSSPGHASPVSNKYIFFLSVIGFIAYILVYISPKQAYGIDRCIWSFHVFFVSLPRIQRGACRNGSQETGRQAEIIPIEPGRIMPAKGKKCVFCKTAHLCAILFFIKSGYQKEKE